MALVVGWLAAGIAGLGCKGGTSASAAALEAGAAAPIVQLSTSGLLLTWIDDKGDFHVETRVEDVPMMGRDIVRVERQSDDPPNPDRIFVVDLRQPGPDGAYPVRSIGRPEFEALAVARREKLGPTLATNATATAAGVAPPAAAAPGSPKSASRTVVIIYGAEWCGACHDAARYLRHKGIAYVEKDIEKDPAAAREMQEKLARHALRAGSIPVIDVRGKVMVGFDPAQIEAALGDAL